MKTVQKVPKDDNSFRGLINGSSSRVRPYQAITNVVRKYSERLAIFKSSNDDEFVFGKSNEYSVSIASGFHDLKACYRLVYESYLLKGIARPNSSRLWYSIFDTNPAAITVAIKKENVIVGTVTVLPDSTIGLPADTLYSKEIGLWRKGNQRVSEVVSLAIDPQLRGANKILLKLTEFSIFIAKEIQKTDGLIITVHPDHVVYYERKLLFKKVGAEKAYEKVAGAVAVLCHLNFVDTEKEMKSVVEKKKSKSSYRFYTLHKNRNKSVETLLNQIKKPAFFSILFFLFKTNILKKASQKQRFYVVRSLFSSC